MFGEMGEAVLLDGQRVLPGRLLDAGFTFARPDLEPALRHALAG
jgi:NAD dependent epimerase/dehydratase family enzyme